MIFACAHSFVMARHSHLEIWPDGLTTHQAGRATAVCWEQIERLVIVPTVFGHRLAADERDGRRTLLAAPRSGLLLGGREFRDEVERVRLMPGGTRTPPPVLTAPGLRRSARLTQLAVVAVLSIIAFTLVR